MAIWYSLTLNQGETHQICTRVMDSFMPKYIGAGRPISMAVFSSLNEQDQSTTLYFTPDAASLAMQFGATPIEDNFNDIDLSLLVGDNNCLQTLFPNLANS